VALVIDARKSRLLLAALVVSHLIVISQQVDGGGGASLLERVVFDLLSPLQRAVAAALRGAQAAWTGYVDLRHVRQENARLLDRLAAAEADLDGERQRGGEAARLRELLDLKKALPLETIAAEVVARDGTPWFRTMTLDRGSTAGVELNAAVMSPTGVLGRVIGVGPRAARVQLLLDRDSGVAVLIERSRVTGVVSGQLGAEGAPKNALIMKYVSALADVAVGDRILTSGLDRIYPKGLVVGRVLAIGPAAGLFKEVQVSPSARFDQVELVLVVRGHPAPTTLTESVR
jgi:rod shape-determining protein MreC